jgi:hypothetical protein
VVFAVGETTCVPLKALAPVNVPPEAVHELALVLDHVRVVELPLIILAGLADMVAVTGGGGTATTNVVIAFLPVFGFLTVIVLVPAVAIAVLRI